MKTSHFFHKMLFVVIVMLTMAQSLSAQRNDQYEYNSMDIFAGPRVGAAMSNLTQLNGDFRFGPYIGGFLELHINPKIAVSFELSYSYEGTRNAKCNFVDYTPDTKSNINMHMLNTGYRFRYYILPQLNLTTGIHMMRVMHAKGETNGQSVKLHHKIRRGNLSFPFGAEVNFGPLAVEACYYLPLRKWTRNNELNDILGTAKTNLVTLTVGYKFYIF